MEQEKLLKKLGQILAKLKIPYLVTGGIAVVAWGRPRFTADIDVVIELLPEKFDKLAAELLKIDKEAYVDKLAMSRALEQKGEFNFIHPASGLKIDFWILKNDSFDHSRMQRRVKKRIGGTNLYFTSPEDLILIKLLWYKKSSSEQQLRDVESIFKIQTKLDMKYIKKWSKIHSTAKILEKLMKGVQ